jgi:hypothetical protein
MANIDVNEPRHLRHHVEDPLLFPQALRIPSNRIGYI